MSACAWRHHPDASREGVRVCKAGYASLRSRRFMENVEFSTESLHNAQAMSPAARVCKTKCG